MSSSSPPSYWDYLQLDSLLSSQGGLDRDEEQLLPDELHFIIVHQVFELWFKLILRELRLARDNLAEQQVPEEKVPYVVHHLDRVNAVLSLMVEQFRVVETLTPQDFLAFRDKLVPASGFQSFQMREMEILLGLEDAQREQTGLDPIAALKASRSQSAAGAAAWERIETARSELNLRTCLHGWLHRTPIRGSGPNDAGDDEVVNGFIQDYMDAYERLHESSVATMAARLEQDPARVRSRFEEAHATAHRFLFAHDVAESEKLRTRRIRAGLLFIESYRELPLLAWPRRLVDATVELDEQLVLWRNRHARMVERTIGRRVGTGGSSGVDYLDQTARYRIFPELWAVRTLLLSRDDTPNLADPSPYGFAH